MVVLLLQASSIVLHKGFLSVALVYTKHLGGHMKIYSMAFAQELACQFLSKCIGHKKVLQKNLNVNYVANAFDIFYSSPDHYIPLFSLFFCSLGCFNFQRYLQSIYMGNFYLSQKTSHRQFSQKNCLCKSGFITAMVYPWSNDLG